jgi:hypothetical protein
MLDSLSNSLTCNYYCSQRSLANAHLAGSLTNLWAAAAILRSTTLRRLIARRHTPKRQRHIPLRIVPMQLIHIVLRLHTIEGCGKRTVFTVQHSRRTIESETGRSSCDIVCVVVGWKKANASVTRMRRGDEESCVRPGGFAGSSGGVGVSDEVFVGINCD